MCKTKCDHCGARWGLGDGQFRFNKDELDLICSALCRQDFRYGSDEEQELLKKIEAMYEKSV